MRVETRLLEKTADGVGVAAWAPRTFLWNAEGTAVTEVTNAAPAVRENVLGTNHDIPDGATCLRCHIGQNGHDMVNGFSAFQLNHDDSGVTLQALLDRGRLTTPIARADAQVPGTATDVAALGYLHANCGYCHRPGGDLTVLTYGTLVHVAQAAAEEMGIDAEIIDLRTLLPLDVDCIVQSVRTTGRCLVVHEATLTSGFGAELSATVQERAFHHLEAPVTRVCGYDTPYPHAHEWAYFPGPQRVGRAMQELMRA